MTEQSKPWTPEAAKERSGGRFWSAEIFEDDRLAATAFGIDQAECDRRRLLIAAAPEMAELLREFADGSAFEAAPLLVDKARMLLARIGGAP